jgi:hypothetical protein
MVSIAGMPQQANDLEAPCRYNNTTTKRARIKTLNRALLVLTD